MERRVLLLGLLRKQDMHGYHINELIDVHLGSSVELKKPTVYKLLDRMVDSGWIRSKQQRVGNYPPRRVYTITSQGESAFQRMVRDSIATYKPISFLGNIGAIFLNELPSREAADLLTRRLQAVMDHLEYAENDEHHDDTFAPMLAYQHHHLAAEIRWLEEEINRLENE